MKIFPNMEIVWYIPVAIFFASLLLIILITFIITKFCCSSKKEKNYRKLNEKENEDKKVTRKNSDVLLGEIYYVDEKDKTQLKLPNVSSLDESSAERAMSDIESESYVLTAYGDSTSINSMDSKASWLTLNTVTRTNLHVQCSLIYSRDMKYVAGKILQLDGLNLNDSPKGLQAKVHVVVLPSKKYALKTNWYDAKNSKALVGEYFKFKFRKIPVEHEIVFRIRAYGRHNNIGILGNSKCMGECFVSLSEIIKARGGLTLWRLLTRTFPKAESMEAE